MQYLFHFFTLLLGCFRFVRPFTSEFYSVSAVAVRDWRGGYMVFDKYTRKRIVFFQNQGYCPQKIAALLQEEGLKGSRREIAKFLAWVKATGSLVRCPGSGQPSRVTEVKQIVEANEDWQWVYGRATTCNSAVKVTRYLWVWSWGAERR